MMRPAYSVLFALMTGEVKLRHDRDAVSLANGGVLCYNTFNGDVKTRTKIKQYIWAALCIAYTVFIAAMQIYCFWKL
jgi:hypothetical protein